MRSLIENVKKLRKYPALLTLAYIAWILLCTPGAIWVSTDVFVVLMFAPAVIVIYGGIIGCCLVTLVRAARNELRQKHE